MLVTWLGAARKVTPAGSFGVQQASLASVARLATTWAVLAYMGLQSMLFYGQLTWIPQILANHGFSAGQIGFWFGAFNLLGLPTRFSAQC